MDLPYSTKKQEEIILPDLNSFLGEKQVLEEKPLEESQLIQNDSEKPLEEENSLEDEDITSLYLASLEKETIQEKEYPEEKESLYGKAEIVLPSLQTIKPPPPVFVSTPLAKDKEAENRTKIDSSSPEDFQKDSQAALPSLDDFTQDKDQVASLFSENPVILDAHFREAVEKILKKGRRYFGSAGASLTHEAYDPARKKMGIPPELAKVGLQGERITSRKLQDWIADKPSLVLIDSIKIPGLKKDIFEFVSQEELALREDKELDLQEGGDTDHVIVMGKTVYIVDSKNWKDKKTYKITEQGEIKRSNRSFPGGRVNALGARNIWEHYLKDIPDITIKSVIVITQENITIVKNKDYWHAGFRLLSYHDLLIFFDEEYQKWQNKIQKNEEQEELSVDLISMILLGAIKPYDVYKEKLAHTYSKLSKELGKAH